MTNSADTDQTPHSVVSDLGLHCLHRPVCPNTYSKYGNLITASPSEIILDPPLLITFERITWKAAVHLVKSLQTY